MATTIKRQLTTAKATRAAKAPLRRVVGTYVAVDSATTARRDAPPRTASPAPGRTGDDAAESAARGDQVRPPRTAAGRREAALPETGRPVSRARTAAASLALPSGLDGPSLAEGNWDTDLPAPDRAKLDPQVRLVISLIRARDFQQLHVRLGIALTPKGQGNHYLPLLVELSALAVPTIADLQIWARFFMQFRIPLGYLVEFERFKKLSQVTARILLDPEIYQGQTAKLEKDLSDLLVRANRVSLAVPIPPSGEDSLRDINLPVNRRYNGQDLTGKGAIIGIIDDGCALANWNYLQPYSGRGGVRSRILYLWDPARTSGGSGWVRPTFAISPRRPGKTALFPGYELPKAAIEDAIDNHGRRGDVIDEDAVYAYLGYAIADSASHGTHVMDIAAGNGRALRSTEGVAPQADIIFVQLPRVAVETGGAALMESILDGAAYIFAKATDLNRPAVVNISYGAYLGPHDGTSQIEAGLDQLLASPDRAVVIAAGNGFEDDCHARGTVEPAKTRSLRWIVRPEDPSPNDLEIWYDGTADLQISVIAPDGRVVARNVAVGRSVPLRLADRRIVGSLDHALDPGNGDKRILVTLRPTTADAAYGNNAPAPDGVWQLRLRNVGRGPARMHGWIERDDRGRTRDARRRQSRFHPADAHPANTIVGLANGFHTMCVGGYNTATQQLVRYSACGPTRPYRRQAPRRKPDVLAPAAEDAAGRGVLSASSLRALPSRMNGTSASAPQVTGLVALMFQYHAAIGRRTPLDADTINDLLRRGAAQSGPVEPSRHQEADDRRPIKQSQLMNDVVGAGKVNVVETLRRM